MRVAELRVAYDSIRVGRQAEQHKVLEVVIEFRNRTSRAVSVEGVTGIGFGEDALGSRPFRTTLPARATREIMLPYALDEFGPVQVSLYTSRLVDSSGRELAYLTPDGSPVTFEGWVAGWTVSRIMDRFSG